MNDNNRNFYFDSYIDWSHISTSQAQADTLSQSDQATNQSSLPEFRSLAEVSSKYSMFVKLFNERPLKVIPLSPIQLVNWKDVSCKGVQVLGVALSDACVTYEGFLVTQRIAERFLNGEFKENCMLEVRNYQYIISNNKIWIHITELERSRLYDHVILPLQRTPLKMPIIIATEDDFKNREIRNLDANNSSENVETKVNDEKSPPLNRSIQIHSTPIDSLSSQVNVTPADDQSVLNRTINDRIEKESNLNSDDEAELDLEIEFDEAESEKSDPEVEFDGDSQEKSSQPIEGNYLNESAIDSQEIRTGNSTVESQKNNKSLLEETSQNPKDEPTLTNYDPDVIQVLNQLFESMDETIKAEKNDDAILIKNSSNTNESDQQLTSTQNDLTYDKQADDLIYID